MKSFKYKLRVSKRVEREFEHVLSVCCDLYNAGLQERREAWRIQHKRITHFDQVLQLTEIRRLDADVRKVYAQVAGEALKRVDRAFAAFFRRTKAKQKAGYPRFRARSRYDSFTYGASGFRLEGNKVYLGNIGSVRLRLSRPVEGRIKTCTIKRQPDGWFVIFSAETEPSPLPPSSEAVGIDVGLRSFASLSNGEVIDNPRYYQGSEARLRRAQRKVARRKKGSSRRCKAVKALRKVHQYIGNQRSHFHHCESRRLVDRYGLIVIEDLNVKGLADSRLAKSVRDAGWSSFTEKLAYKAENAGRFLVRVDPRGTSQTCVCGAAAPKALSQRWHECSSCGLSADRDHVSAQVILQRALGQERSGVNVWR